MNAWWAALSFAAGALACLATARDRQEGGWLAAGGVLGVLAVVQVTRADLLATSALRAWAWQSGWYGLRRPAQVIALLAGVLAVRHLARRACVDGLLAAGVGACLLVAWGRMVSLHQLDSLMDARMLGLSWGRWVDAAGLVLVAAAVVRAGARRV